MTKIQYNGISDVRQINTGDTVGGTVPGGMPITVQWNKTNNWIIDTTVAPYTAITAAIANALVALPNHEFVDVTTTPQNNGHTNYNVNTVSGQSVGSSGHVVSQGASTTVVAGAGAASAGLGALGANDQAGTVTATALASGNVADEIICTVTFAVAYGAPPKEITIEATNPAAEGAQLYVLGSSITTSHFQVAAHVAPAASAVMTFSYEVVG